MKKRLLITGCNGQLGSEINCLSPRYSDYDFFFTSKEDLDISDKEQVQNFITKNLIDCIVNCAAYTAVDKAETERESADKINHVAVRNLAELAKEHKIQLIHISTDYVFSGEGHKPYEPNDSTSPVNYYGESKLAGEVAITEINPDCSFIIRTSWVYSSFGNNFVKTMLRLGKERDTLTVISDQVGAPTYAFDLAKFILDYAVCAAHSGVITYHYTNEGVCSWYDFAKEIMDRSGTQCKLVPILTSAYPTPAKRPFYSLMDKTSLKKDFSVEIPYWKNSLQKCLELIK